MCILLYYYIINTFNKRTQNAKIQTRYNYSRPTSFARRIYRQHQVQRVQTSQAVRFGGRIIVLFAPPQLTVIQNLEQMNIPVSNDTDLLLRFRQTNNNDGIDNNTNDNQTNTTTTTAEPTTTEPE